MRDWKEFFLEYENDYEDLLFIKRAYESFYEHLSVVLLSITVYIFSFSALIIRYCYFSNEAFFPFSPSLIIDFLILQVFPLTSFIYLGIIYSNFKKLKNNEYISRILGSDLSFKDIIKQLETCKEISDGYFNKFEESLTDNEAKNILNEMIINNEIINLKKELKK